MKNNPDNGPVQLMDAALALASKGLKVFPLHTIINGKCSCSGEKPCKPGKHPRETGGFHTATTDGKEIKSWWMKWPDANIGLPTGPDNGFFVLDVDIKHDGEDSLKALVEEHGDLPSTVEVNTGGGG